MPRYHEFNHYVSHDHFSSYVTITNYNIFLKLVMYVKRTCFTLLSYQIAFLRLRYMYICIELKWGKSWNLSTLYCLFEQEQKIDPKRSKCIDLQNCFLTDSSRSTTGKFAIKNWMFYLFVFGYWCSCGEELLLFLFYRLSNDYHQYRARPAVWPGFILLVDHFFKFSSWYP